MADVMNQDVNPGGQDPRTPTIEDLMGLVRGSQQNPLTPKAGQAPGTPAMTAPAAPGNSPGSAETNPGGLDPNKMPAALSGMVSPPAPISGQEQATEQNRAASNIARGQAQQANNTLQSSIAARGQLAPPVARDANGKVKPEYKLGIGSRLARIGTDFIGGMSHGGLLGGMAGAARGALDPSDPGYYGKGAVSSRYGRDVATEQAQASNLDDQISHQQKLIEATQGLYGKVNSAESADERAQAAGERADTYKDMSDQRGDKIDPATLAPDDPDHPEGTWHGTTLSGESKRGLSAPPYAARITAQANTQSAEGKTTAARGAIADQYGLKGKDRDMYILNGKVPEGMTPFQQQELALRTREVAVQENKAKGGGKPIPRGTSDKIISDKNKAINAARENFKNKSDKAGDAYDFDDYMNDWQAAQDNFEQQIENNTGEKPEHLDVRSNVDKQGNSIGPNNSQSAPAAKPAATTQATPQEKMLKDGKGNLVHAIVKNGKWVNKQTGAAL